MTTTEPKPTYVNFLPTDGSAELLRRFVTGDLLFPDPTWKFHVTTVYSRSPILYQPIRNLSGSCYTALPLLHTLMILPAYDKLALVLGVNATVLFHSHRQAEDGGASWDYPNFYPHITLAYGLEISDLIEKPLSVPGFQIVFQHAEQVEELDENWRPEKVE